MKILLAILGALIFTTLPSNINGIYNAYAPIDWFVDVQSIEVTDLTLKTMEQDITIYRKVNRELNGFPRQELFQVMPDGLEREVYNVPAPEVPADYEPTTTQSTYLGDSFWHCKGVADDLRRVIEPGAKYRWVWVIEYIRPDGSTEIVRHPSNVFVAY